MAEERGRYLIAFEDIPASRQKVPEVQAEERVGGFGEVELGFTREMAVCEARRCLSCRRCLGCALCVAECHSKAIEFEQAEEIVDLEVDSIVLAPGAEKFPAPVGEELGWGRCANVVSALEFERLLSEDGPTGGWVIRPYDGEIPKRIAFVLPSNHRSDHALALAGKELEAVRNRIDGVEASLFLPASVEPGEVEKHLGKDPWFRLGRAKGLTVREDEETRNILVESAEDAGGRRREEAFDMVVVLTALAIPDSVKDLARKLGLELNGRTFWEATESSLAETSRPGVFQAGYVFDARR